MTADDIVREARSWKGTPYQHQASIKGVACDCIGLLVGVARELGMPEADAFLASPFHAYSKSPEPAALRSAVAMFLDPIIDPLPGDILLLRFEVEPQHFGILSTPDYMVHAWAMSGKCVEHRLDERWRKRIISAFRYRGLES